MAQLSLLLGLGTGVFGRGDDGSGIPGGTFRRAAAELGRLRALLPAHDTAKSAGKFLALLAVT